MKENLDEKRNSKISKKPNLESLDNISLKSKITINTQTNNDVSSVIEDLENLHLLDSNIKELKEIVSNFNLNYKKYLINTNLNETEINISHINSKSTNCTVYSSEKNQKFLSLEDFIFKYIYFEDTILNTFNTLSHSNSSNQQKVELLLEEFNKLWGEFQNTWSNEVWEKYYKIREENFQGNESVDISLNMSYFDLNIKDEKLKEKEEYNELENIEDELNCSVIPYKVNINKIQRKLINMDRRKSLIDKSGVVEISMNKKKLESSFSSNSSNEEDAVEDINNDKKVKMKKSCDTKLCGRSCIIM